MIKANPGKCSIFNIQGPTSIILVLEQVLSTYKGLHASVLYQNKRFQLLRACISLLSSKRCQLSRAYITWLDKSNSNGPKILLVGHSQAEFFAFGLSWVQMIFDRLDNPYGLWTWH